MAEYYQGPNNSASVKVVTLTLISIATVLVTWRISWRMGKRLLGLSDCLLLLGMAFCACLAGFNLDPYFRWGYGYHKADLPPEIQKATTPKICFYLNQIFFKAASGTIKLSVAVIYMDIFKKPVLRRIKFLRYCNFTLMGVIVCYYTAATLVSMFQCTPIRKVWNSSLPGTCIDNDHFRIPNAYINSITSALLVIIPFPALLTMEHRSKELWQFFGLISLGLVHTGCAICRVVQIYNTNPKASTDPQWYNTTPNTIAMAEIFTALLVATAITMRPCFQIFGTAVISTVSNATHSHTSNSRTRHSAHQPTSPRSSTATNPRGHRPTSSSAKREADLEQQAESGSTHDLVRSGHAHGIGTIY